MNEASGVFCSSKARAAGEAGDAGGEGEAEAQSEEASHLQVGRAGAAGVGAGEEDHRLPAQAPGAVDHFSTLSF